MEQYIITKNETHHKEDIISLDGSEDNMDILQGNGVAKNHHITYPHTNI